jgi:AraC-like DNA-binding protein
MDWRYRRRAGVLHDRSLFIGEPGELHDTTSVRSPGSIRVLMLPPALVEEVARDLGGSAPVHLREPGTARLDVVLAFGKLLGRIEDPQGTPIETQTHLVESLGLLLAHCGERPPRRVRVRDHPVIRRAKEVLLDRFSDNLSLEEVAREVGRSQYRLAHVFREAVVIGICAYLINVRVNRAHAYLATGLSPALVASLAGFADQSHLGRHFSRLVGGTPSEYARQVCAPSARVPLAQTARYAEGPGA